MPIPNVLIISTHPIQYQVPWFQFLAKQPTINLKVLGSLGMAVLRVQNEPLSLRGIC